MTAQVSASGRPLRPADRRLIVLRHGITADNARGVWQGHLNTPLSPQGRDQALAVAATIAAYRPSLIVSSDLDRAADTARVIADACQLELRLDDRLREVNAGQWQGLSAAAVRERFPQLSEALERGEDLQRGVDGERLSDVAARAGQVGREVGESLAAGQLAVLVTHGVAARALVADLTGIPQRSAWLGLSGLGNCNWGELREHDGRWRLYAWNMTARGSHHDDRGEQSAY